LLFQAFLELGSPFVDSHAPDVSGDEQARPCSRIRILTAAIFESSSSSSSSSPAILPMSLATTVLRLVVHPAASCQTLRRVCRLGPRLLVHPLFSKPLTFLPFYNSVQKSECTFRLSLYIMTSRPQVDLAVAEALMVSWASHQLRNLDIIGTSHLTISMRTLKR
jgi:hypothetical protein